MAAFPIYGVATKEFMEREWRVNGIWSTIFTHHFPPAFAIDSFMISPEAYPNPQTTQGRQADLLVSQWRQVGNDLLSRPVLCYEGKGGGATETLDTAREQLQNWLKNAGVKSGQYCWAVAAKGLQVKFWRWNPHNSEERRLEPVELARDPLGNVAGINVIDGDPDSRQAYDLVVDGIQDNRNVIDLIVYMSQNIG